jgi:hypothetical protein
VQVREDVYKGCVLCEVWLPLTVQFGLSEQEVSVIMVGPWVMEMCEAVGLVSRSRDSLMQLASVFQCR